MSRQGTELRQKRRQLGLCCQCGSPAQGKSRCPSCLRKAAESRRRYVARMTPDEREKMYQKEYLRQRLAKDMAVEISHRKYLEEITRATREPLNITVKLKPMAQMMLEAERGDR